MEFKMPEDSSFQLRGWSKRLKEENDLARTQKAFTGLADFAKAYAAPEIPVTPPSKQAQAFMNGVQDMLAKAQPALEELYRWNGDFGWPSYYQAAAERDERSRRSRIVAKKFDDWIPNQYAQPEPSKLKPKSTAPVPRLDQIPKRKFQFD